MSFVKFSKIYQMYFAQNIIENTKINIYTSKSKYEFLNINNIDKYVTKVNGRCK